MQIINKTTNGRTLVISYINGEFVATVDGVEITRASQPGMYSPAKKLHIFAGKIGMSQEEGAKLIAAYNNRSRAVAITRDDLIATYNGLIDAAEAAANRAPNTAAAVDARSAYDARIAAAAAAIAAYDAAHPEETAARKAETAAIVARNINN